MTTAIPEANTYVRSTDNQTGVIECRGCGEKQAYVLPMSVDAWLKMTKDFNRENAQCPKNTAS